jgi:glycosyltransferase involved in cell wall biosynthesis
MPQKKILSVIVPLYNEEDGFAELKSRLQNLSIAPDFELEVLFVNDGSSDATGQLIDAAANESSMFTGLHLSRNFGHQAAVAAGLTTCTGDFVAIIDGDLQDPPELIPRFLEKGREGFDVIYAIRRKRKESLFKKVSYSAFYRFLNLLSPISIPLDSGDFCLMSRKVVDQINLMPERNRFIRGLRTFAGFRQFGFEYDRDARAAGIPKYTFKKLLSLAADGIFSFSSKPLKIATVLGALSIFAAVLYTIRTVAWRLFSGEELPGFATIVVILLYFGSVQLFCIGILGEYISRIYDEVKARPNFIIARVAKTPHCSDPNLP